MNKQINKIKLLAMDVDGVLTDGGIIVHKDGTESKKFHVHDGAWLRIWKRNGFKTAIITGRQCDAVGHRMESLEIDWVYQKAWDKKEVFEQLLKDSGVQPEEIAYIGDDIFDLPVISRVGFAASVADGLADIREACDYVTSLPGGRGAVGELVRYMLKQKGLWEKSLEKYKQ